MNVPNLAGKIKIIQSAMTGFVAGVAIESYMPTIACSTTSPYSRRICGRGVRHTDSAAFTVMWSMAQRPTANIPFEANHFVLLSERGPATAQPDSDNSQHQQQIITADELPDSSPQQEAATVTVQPVSDLTDADTDSPMPVDSAAQEQSAPNRTCDSENIDLDASDIGGSAAQVDSARTVCNAQIDTLRHSNQIWLIDWLIEVDLYAGLL